MRGSSSNPGYTKASVGEREAGDEGPGTQSLAGGFADHSNFSDAPVSPGHSGCWPACVRC